MKVRLPALFLMFLLALAATPSYAASQESLPDIWREVVRDTLAVLKNANQAALVEPASRTQYAKDLAALDRRVAKLFETLPEKAQMENHLRLLPLSAEVLSAAKALGEAADAQDDVAAQVAEDWLQRAVIDLRVGLSSVSP